MKKTQKKFKWLSCLLVLGLILNAVPLTVSADEGAIVTGVFVEDFPGTFNPMDPTQNLCRAVYEAALADPATENLVNNGRNKAEKYIKSSSASNATGPANALDGDRVEGDSKSNSWACHSTDLKEPGEIGVAVNFQSPKTFDTVYLFGKNLYSTGEIRIEYSMDANDWESLPNDAGGSWRTGIPENNNWKVFGSMPINVTKKNDLYKIVFEGENVTAQYVRFVQVLKEGGGNSTPLFSFEIYNRIDPGEEVPAEPAVPEVPAEPEVPALQGISRAEFTSLVAKTLELAPENETGFTDIAATDAFGQDVGAAFKAGLVAGVGDGKFEPARAIKREEAAVILAGALKYKNKAAEADNSALNAFGDKDSISSWAVDKVAQVVKAGIMGGVDASTFAPAIGMSGEEANAIISNFNSYVATAPDVPAAEAPAKVDGPNLALGKTATASNSNSKAQPGNALDGDLETVWRTNGPSDKNNFMQYTVDLGAATTFNKIVLNKLYNPQKYKPGTGKVEISNDGQTWTQIATMDTFEDVVTITFDDVTARYVRVYADKAEDPDPTIGFHEFELYHAQ